MNQADEELRVTITQIWPLQANKMIDLLVPPIHQLNKNNLTVGKIYGGLLILETWKNTKFYELKLAKEVKKLNLYFSNISFLWLPTKVPTFKYFLSGRFLGDF